MKLNIVPARTGLVWVKLGITTFWRQPLALSGLFFLFMGVVSIASLVPYLGSLLALVVLPGATLGLIAATDQATQGKFPMPAILLTAFRAGQQRLRAMLLLGALYALGFLATMGVSALFDGGQFAQLYLMGAKLTPELIESSDFRAAMWAAAALYLPLSLMFWHAPALVHWHGVAPIKSLFFSGFACLRNLGAFLVYGVTWMVLFVVTGTVVLLAARLAGGAPLASAVMLPMALLMAAMFFTSIYFTVRDCFVADEPAVP